MPATKVSAVRTACRGANTIARIGFFLAQSSLMEAGMAARKLSHRERQRRRARNCSLHAAGLMRFLGIEGRYAGWEKLESLQGGALIVCNHLSFWDMIALSAKSPVIYITSVEVRDTPVLGWIARLGGAAFVERRSRERIDAEITDIQAQLAAGQRVVLFPEGTSSDGSGVLPFKRSLFRAAVRSGRPIVPVCINYREIDGKPVDAVTREWIFYYGDHGFGEQLWKVMGLQNISIELEACDPLRPADSPDAHTQACSESYAMIRERYSPIASDANLRA